MSQLVNRFPFHQAVFFSVFPPPFPPPEVFFALEDALDYLDWDFIETLDGSFELRRELATWCQSAPFKLHFMCDSRSLLHITFANESEKYFFLLGIFVKGSAFKVYPITLGKELAI